MIALFAIATGNSGEATPRPSHQPAVPEHDMLPRLVAFPREAKTEDLAYVGVWLDDSIDAWHTNQIHLSLKL